MLIEPSEQVAIGFFTDAVQLFKLQAEEKNIDLKIDISGNDGESGSVDTQSVLCPHDVVRVDEHKMKQVVRNLVSNALKFTEVGKPVTIKMWKTSELLPVKKPDEIIIEPLFNETASVYSVVLSTVIARFSIINRIRGFLRSILGYHHVANSVVPEEPSIADIENNLGVFPYLA